MYNPTMIEQNQQALRDYYTVSWKKHGEQLPLTDLERQIVEVINEHPEVQTFIEHPQDNDDKSFYLHLGLHLGLREQLNTNRPSGILSVFKTLSEKIGAHEAEHKMMSILEAALWKAQKNKAPPSEEEYIKTMIHLIK